jgi:16S rRNA (adenine1518-N6/adenine1519-N6)-dimethyltransferase
VRAKKSLGQNFLIDQIAIDRIVDAVDPRTEDHVIEIGPGHGALTGRLLERGCRVTAIEFDRELIPVLEQRFSSNGRFRLVHKDILNTDLADLANDTPAKLVGNLPYNISTPILQRIIVQRASLASMVLMFQREVVKRMTAAPGEKDRGYLTVLVEAAFEVETLFTLPPSSFRPAPKVWSSVVRLLPKPINTRLEEDLKLVAATAFRQKRKTIINNLKQQFPMAEAALSAAAIDTGRRAETLTMDEWRLLTDALVRQWGPLIPARQS